MNIKIGAKIFKENIHFKKSHKNPSSILFKKYIFKNLFKIYCTKFVQKYSKKIFILKNHTKSHARYYSTNILQNLYKIDYTKIHTRSLKKILFEFIQKNHLKN